MRSRAIFRYIQQLVTGDECVHMYVPFVRRDYRFANRKKIFKIIAPASCETRVVPLADYSEAGCGLALVQDVDHCVFYVE